MDDRADGELDRLMTKRHDPRDGEAFLERAERTGDPELAAAVYHVATERGERSVADAYLETRPKERQRWEEYVEAHTESQSLDRLFGRAFTEKFSPAREGQ